MVFEYVWNCVFDLVEYRLSDLLKIWAFDDEVADIFSFYLAHQTCCVTGLVEGGFVGLEYIGARKQSCLVVSSSYISAIRCSSLPDGVWLASVLYVQISKCSLCFRFLFNHTFPVLVNCFFDTLFLGLLLGVGGDDVHDTREVVFV